MQGRLVRRRCSDADHMNLDWVKENPEVARQFPGGEFLANLDEEDAVKRSAIAPTYMLNRRWLGYCPYHRKKKLKTWASTIREYIEYYMEMFEQSAGKQGLDPERVRAAGLDPDFYKRPKRENGKQAK
jgi:hypothetical protein